MTCCEVLWREFTIYWRGGSENYEEASQDVEAACMGHRHPRLPSKQVGKHKLGADFTNTKPYSVCKPVQLMCNIQVEDIVMSKNM